MAETTDTSEPVIPVEVAVAAVADEPMSAHHQHQEEHTVLGEGGMDLNNDEEVVDVSTVNVTMEENGQPTLTASEDPSAELIVNAASLTNNPDDEKDDKDNVDDLEESSQDEDASKRAKTAEASSAKKKKRAQKYGEDLEDANPMLLVQKLKEEARDEKGRKNVSAESLERNIRRQSSRVAALIKKLAKGSALQEKLLLAAVNKRCEPGKDGGSSEQSHELDTTIVNNLVEALAKTYCAGGNANAARVAFHQTLLVGGVGTNLKDTRKMSQAAKRLGVSRKKMMEAMREREGYNVGERWVVELAQRKHGGGNNGASSSGQHNSIDPDSDSKRRRKRKGDNKDKDPMQQHHHPGLAPQHPDHQQLVQLAAHGVHHTIGVHHPSVHDTGLSGELMSAVGMNPDGTPALGVVMNSAVNTNLGAMMDQ